MLALMDCAAACGSTEQLTRSSPVRQWSCLCDDVICPKSKPFCRLMEKCELGSRLESDPSFALLSFSSLSSRRCGCKQVFLQCGGLNKSDLTHSKTTQLCIVRSLNLIRCPAEEYMSWLMIALASLYTVYKSWSHCIIQPERGANSGAVTKVIKFTFPHTQTQVAFVQTLEGKKSVCVCVWWGLIDCAAGCRFILDGSEDHPIPLLTATVLILWKI